MGFFSAHSKFGETSEVSSNLRRLDFRYRHVIERNRPLLEGKRILDIASHDGRFSFAALKGAGAYHVVGIEARQHLVDASRKSLRDYGIAEDRYQFHVGDVFEEIHKIKAGSIDTAMILGFLYHTARQYELFAALDRLGVKNLIIDSNVLKNRKRPVLQLRIEGTKKDAQIWDKSRPRALSAFPSALALEYYMREFGFEVTHLDPVETPPPAARQYADGGRVTLIGTKD